MPQIKTLTITKRGDFYVARLHRPLIGGRKAHLATLSDLSKDDLTNGRLAEFVSRYAPKQA